MSTRHRRSYEIDFFLLNVKKYFGNNFCWQGIKRCLIWLIALSLSVMSNCDLKWHYESISQSTENLSRTRLILNQLCHWSTKNTNHLLVSASFLWFMTLYIYLLPVLVGQNAFWRHHAPLVFFHILQTKWLINNENDHQVQTCCNHTLHFRL